VILCCGDSENSGLKLPEAELGLFESILHFPANDVLEMRRHNLNCGYPIVLTVMAMIEAVASVIYAKGGNTEPKDVARYFADYFSRVSPRYSPLLLDDQTEAARKLGFLLYNHLRCRLAHKANSTRAFPVDAQLHTYHRHLMREPDGGILLHAYHLYDDFLTSLIMINQDALASPDFMIKIREGIDNHMKNTERENRNVVNRLAYNKI